MSDTSDKISTMLATAQRAWQRGKQSSALAVVHLLQAEYPEDERIKAVLTEFETALDALPKTAQTVAAEPPASSANTASERITIVLPETHSPADTLAPARSHVIEQAPETAWPPLTKAEPQEIASVQQIRWPMYAIIAIALAIILLTALWRWGGIFAQPGDTVLGITPSFVPVNTLMPTLAAGAEPGSGPPFATTAADPATAVQPTPTATAIPSTLPTATATATTTPLPTITPRPVLSQGQIVQSGTWSLSLLRPEHAMLLDGSIGALQPKGRFVLVLLSVGYNGQGAATIPATLVTLEDDQGQLYQADPSASRAYLDTFGHGQYGDISQDQQILPDAGNLSVPFIFDVPASAHQLHIVVIGQEAVWSIVAR